MGDFLQNTLRLTSPTEVMSNPFQMSGDNARIGNVPVDILGLGRGDMHAGDWLTQGQIERVYHTYGGDRSNRLLPRVSGDEYIDGYPDPYYDQRKKQEEAKARVDLDASLARLYEEEAERKRKEGLSQLSRGNDPL
jgi:hypothetical protein